MISLGNDIIKFFESQGYVIVSTVTKTGAVHNSCKGIFEINQKGTIYLCDLYHGATYKNLVASSTISVTAVDEHRFKGYCLQGTAKVVRADKLSSLLLTQWEARIASRITQRLLKNITGTKGHPLHPEALLPEPKFIIVVHVAKIIDLTPQHITS